MKPHSALHRANDSTRECREACVACAQTCTEMVFTHCLDVGGEHATTEHVRAMIDCSAICTTAADFMSRASPQHHVICHACTIICRTCADSCRDLDGMEPCVAACERCEASCRAMAQSAA